MHSLKANQEARGAAGKGGGRCSPFFLSFFFGHSLYVHLSFLFSGLTYSCMYVLTLLNSFPFCNSEYASLYFFVIVLYVFLPFSLIPPLCFNL